VANFSGPIPGQSLTKEPGGSPWEQPPLYAENEKAIAFHMKNLSDEDKMSDLLYILDQGMPLNTIVETMMTMGVMEGYHTLDTAILIGPVVHEYVKEMAMSADINLKEWSGPTPDQKKKAKDNQRVVAMLGSQLNTTPTAQSPKTELVPDAPANKPKVGPVGLIERPEGKK
jgi:hypothetical protein